MPYDGISSVSYPNSNQPNFWFSFTCGYCQTKVNGQVVATSQSIKWLLCTSCGNGSVFTNDGILFPPQLTGPIVEGLPTEISNAYDESRRCYSVNSYTSCELMCRKILMHVAVEKNAKEGDTFENYIKYLEGSGYVTPPMRGWVDLIRRHGNKSTHKLEAPDQKRAESTLMLTAELLKLIYEMEHKANQYAKPP